jgi:PA14 domain
VRLWINGQLIVDNWWDRGHTEGTGTINLVLGQSYDIRMEYYEKGGGASATLAWSSARQAKEIVPQGHLFVPSKSGNYWSNGLDEDEKGSVFESRQIGFDAVNRVSAQASYFASNCVGRFDYGYDALSRRIYEQGDFGLADGYQYDATDQMIGYQRDGRSMPAPAR